ncbi:MAG: Undecaprenyl phosphate-alpha-4-amino-4-deoxy-L-arabinose arabinosyl transferase [Bacteroidia bacterium]|nr:Undecaprenyl phosphate-alpha-4-amino-4-deoxy-L-arabinose arabinosyl transferase [Bacteroidia bacterium]
MLNKTQSYFFFAAIIAVYIISSFIDVMDVDAAQYASIAREMLERGDYLHITNRYQDYLDKPPLLFWLSALSFKVFGISNFAYKLPSLLFALLGIFSTYKLGKLLYSEKTGMLSALMFASCQAMFLITNDVRTDTILTGAIIFSIWNIAAFNQSGKWISLLAGFTGIALAMLAKGPIGLMAPALAFGSHFILKRAWKSIFRWQWILGLLIVAVLLTPMFIGLYQQFDARPEKNISGIRFFLWDQSFGRLTGDNPFINSQQKPQHTDPFFFVHSFLWAFLPWSLFFIFGYWQKFKTIFFSKFKLSENDEAITTGGFTLVFIAMSFSDYKLPHYIFIVFPLAAIISADCLLRVFENSDKKKLQEIFSVIQKFTIALIWLVILSLCIYSFPIKSMLLWIGLIAFAAATVYFFFEKSEPLQKLITASLVTMIGANFMLSTHFYPTLLSYQSTVAAGRFIESENIPNEQFVCYISGGHSLDFYSRRIVPWIQSPQAINDKLQKGEVWVFTNDEGKQNFEKENLLPDSVIIYSDYKVTMLSLPFLKPAEREKMLKKKYLLKFQRE